jgi:hypothetical protein
VAPVREVGEARTQDEEEPPVTEQQPAVPMAPPPQGLPSSIVPPDAVTAFDPQAAAGDNQGTDVDGEDGDDPPPTEEMPATIGPPPRADTPAAGMSTALVPLPVAAMELELDKTQVPSGPRPPVGGDFDGDDDDDYYDDDLSPRRKTVLWALAGAAMVLALLSGVVARVVLDSSETQSAAAEPGAGSSSQVETSDSSSSSSSGSTSSTSSTSTSSTTTSTSTTSTTAPTTTVPPTTTPTTVPPTTAPPTTAPPAAPSIDSFSVDVDDRGCGFGASPAHFSWSTTNATSVTLGRSGGGGSGVAADGSSGEICVSDSGETWRLTATGPGGTTTRDVRT